jgi:pSer/pThr/pTyr-binding forkhead associated (FHA) protein
MLVKLLVVRGKPQGKSVVFPRGEYVIGRGPECQLRPNSSWVSRQHCLVRVGDRAAHIRDLGSTNGTLVNGQRLVGERNLEEGDLVQLGPLVFEVRFDDSVIAAGAEPHLEAPPEGEQYGTTAEMPSLPGVAPLNGARGGVVPALH